MDDLHRLVGRLEQSAVDVKEDIQRLDNRLTGLDARLAALHTVLNDINPKLDQAFRHASDWERTKKKGLLYLAGVGASGLTIGHLTGKSVLAYLASLIPIFPK